MPADYPSIEDYAIIGDCGSAALVSRHGSVDWLCWPQFDSPSIFGALLDAGRGGTFSIRPTGEYTVGRRYIDDTNVLKTTFTTPTGILHLIDLMPVTANEEYDRVYWPDHELMRTMHCEEGEVEIEIHFAPRPDYGRIQPRFEQRGALGYFFDFGAQVLVVRSEVDLTLADDRSSLSARAVIGEGERRHVSVTYEVGRPAVLPALGASADRKIEQTLAYWRDWSAVCDYDGPFRDAVMRSALALKLMTFSRSGAIVAAPTTSLPEKIGGIRNWDYRNCWLRDASLTLRALFGLGYQKEGRAFFHWLLHALGGTQPDLNALYDVYGNSHEPSEELDHLEGYRQSRPVRVGNDAIDQLQLDMYGEVACAAFEFVSLDGRLNRKQRRLLVRLGRRICERWTEPDEGIWEIRSGRRQHTYSKVMCWVALDRLLRLHDVGHLRVPADRFSAVQQDIRRAVETHGYNDEMNSYVSTFDGHDVDASLLLLPTYGYIDADAPRMRSTFACIKKHLGHGVLLHRYLHRTGTSDTDHETPRPTNDGLPPGEGAFGLCSFWDEEYMALCGDVETAQSNLEEMLTYANDVGLFAEQIDPKTGAALGNFPQAFTHIGLINTALTIAAVKQRRRQPAADLHQHP